MYYLILPLMSFFFCTILKLGFYIIFMQINKNVYLPKNVSYWNCGQIITRSVLDYLLIWFTAKKEFINTTNGPMYLFELQDYLWFKSTYICRTAYKYTTSSEWYCMTCSILKNQLRRKLNEIFLTGPPSSLHI